MSSRSSPQSQPQPTSPPQSSRTTVPQQPHLQRQPHSSIPPARNRASNAEYTAQLEHDAEQLADFVTAKDRLRDRVVTARSELDTFRAAVEKTNSQFSAQLEDVRRIIAELNQTNKVASSKPDDPPST